MAHEDNKIKLKQILRWLPADMETPISIYLKFAGADDGILLESAEVDGRWGRYSILACGMLFFASCDNGNLVLDIRDTRFESLMAYNGLPFVDGLRALMRSIEIIRDEGMASLPPITRAFYGYMGFGMASVFNPHLQKNMPLAEADCIMAFPATVMVFDHLYNRLCRLDIGGGPKAEKSIPAYNDTMPDLDKIQSMPGEQGYKDYVKNIRGQLRQGEAIQVVPSCHFSVPYNGDPFNIYRRMRRYNASPYMFYMNFPEITLFGSSPEVMVRCTDDVLHLSPIAGTRRRGKTDSEDAALAAELLADPKERAEHVMLVDLGRNDLGRIAETGSVEVEKFMQIERFSHVMHITSSITARLAKDGNRQLDALDVLAATFPAGTVSGAPKFRAMEIIRSLEGKPRGPYAGCIGWIGLDPGHVNMDMGITIRSMWAKNGVLHWQTGGGIVHDSDPDLEWREVCNKSAIMHQAIMPEEENYVPADR